MDFLIHLPLEDLENAFAFQDEKPAFLQWTAGKAALPLQHFRHGDDHLYLIGDLVLPSSYAEETAIAAYLSQQLRRGAVAELKGFFYLLLVNVAEKRLEVHSSFLNILPVYYRQTAGQITISSSLKRIVESSDQQPRISEHYVVEKLLFYYAFLNRTPFEGIHTIPSCHFLRVEAGRLRFPVSVELSDFFVSRPRKWRDHLDSLSQLFKEEAAAFIPKQPFALTLTGGFDGRTILALALHQQATFSTFSYGLPTDPDVIVPRQIGRRLGFEHRHFDLGLSYAKDRFWDDGVSFVRQTEGAGNFSRAHYVHTADSLAPDFPFLLSGNFGSELLRSMKSPGVMASPVLFDLFSCESKDDFMQKTAQTPALRFVDRETYAEAVEAVAEEAWTYKTALPEDLTTNQRFHLYMFGEVFRKYFGPEIVMQSNYLRHRAPFLNHTLVKALLGTTLAGANSNFRETNPIRRFHGQVLYAHVLLKTFPQLLDIPLDRGYRPRDLLTWQGPLNIAWSYWGPHNVRRKLKELPAFDADYYTLNKDKIASRQAPGRVLSPDRWKQVIAEGKWDQGDQDLVNALSMELYYSE